MKKIFLTVILASIFISTIVQAQQKDEARFTSEKFDKAVPWTHLNFHNNPENFQFAIVSDRTGGHREGVFGKAVSKINLLQPEFVMSVGDFIEGYSKDTTVLNEEWDEFNNLLEPLQMPFFYLPGNHDFSNSVMREQWLERYGKDYYYFTYKDVLFITMNTNDGDGVIFGQDQIDYTKQVLADHPDVRWTFVFMHHPIWRYNDINNFTEIEEALEGRDFTVFAGHTHRYMHEVRDNSNYYVLGTTGGGSALRGPKFGQFDHFTWVTMTNEGPTIVNLKLDGIIDHNISTEETGKLASELLNSTKFKELVMLALQTASSGVKSFANNFNGAELKFKVENTSDKPLFFKGRFFHNHHVSPDLDRIEEELAPHTSKVYTINLEAVKNIPVSDLDALELDWTMGYEVPHLDHPFELSGTHKIEINPQPKAIEFTKDEIFLDNIEVAINQPFDKLDLHYTLDGSEPTEDSPLYKSPIQLTETKTVKVKLFGENGASSEVVEKTYAKTSPLKAVKKKSKPGLAYAYYEGEFKEIPAFESLTAKKKGVSNDLDVETLAAGRENYYAFLFNGYVEVPEEGVYTFYTYSDDGSKLFINDQLVVDNGGSHSAKLKEGQVVLSKGKHPLKIEYFEDFDGQDLRLGWEGPGVKKGEIPAEFLTH
ncbi:MAG: hypothetical protein CMO01_28515 [Thalassobius sp.]|nr:hypothetical protein [Thalassovita sp.]